eukprot:366117-Chlamydomonas_euryale.AAC.7
MDNDQPPRHFVTRWLKMVMICHLGYLALGRRVVVYVACSCSLAAAPAANHICMPASIPSAHICRQVHRYVQSVPLVND